MQLKVVAGAFEGRGSEGLEAGTLSEKVYSDIIEPIQRGEFPDKRKLVRLGINFSIYEVQLNSGDPVELNLQYTSNGKLPKVSKIVPDRLTVGLFQRLCAGRENSIGEILDVSRQLGLEDTVAMARRQGLATSSVGQELRILMREGRDIRGTGTVYLISLNQWGASSVGSRSDLDAVRLNLLCASDSFLANIGNKSYGQLVEVVGHRNDRPGRVVRNAVQRALLALFYQNRDKDVADFKARHLFPQRVDLIDTFVDHRAYTLVELQTILGKLFGARIPHEVVLRCIADINLKKSVIQQGPPSPVVYVPESNSSDTDAFDNAINRFDAIKAFFADHIEILAGNEIAIKAVIAFAVLPGFLQRTIGVFSGHQQ